MSANPPRPDDVTADLETALGRALPQAEPQAARYALLRLRPVVLPPPPGELPQQIPSQQVLQEHVLPEQVLPEYQVSVTAEDDIPMDDDDDGSARRRQLLLGATGVGIAALGLVAFLVFGVGRGADIAATVPTIKADPAAQAKGPAPAAEGQTTNTSMGDVSSELVPPSTEGLTPARRVSTTRIRVENDREIALPK